MATLLLPAFFIAAALVLLYAAFKNLKKARTIEDVPTSKIRSAHQGYVELIGIAKQQQEQENITHAPLTNSACLWYDFKIERYQGGKNSHWSTIEKGCSEDLFSLFDGSGECLIDPRHSDVLTSVKKRWSGYHRHPAHTQHTQQTSLLGRLRRQRYRYTERRIQADQPLYAIGWFQTFHASSAEQQQKDYVAKLISTWKQDYSKMLERFDSNRDGHIDQREWQRAREQAAQEAQQYVADNYQDTDIHIMSKPTTGQAYMLSTSDPAELTNHYRWKSVGMLLTGLLSSGISIWFVLNRL